MPLARRVIRSVPLSELLALSYYDEAMPIFKVLSRVDAYVDYIAEVEADTAEEAVDIAYDNFDGAVKWEEQGVVEFDARHVVALGTDGEEIEGTARGKG